MSASALLHVLKTHSVATAWPAQSASAAATSCPVKNGLPSARAYPSSANWAGADPPARAATCSAVFSRESGPSRISSTSLPPRAFASHAATTGSRGDSSPRHVTTTVTAPRRPASGT